MDIRIISETDLSNGPWVDLGLPSGKMWASCNLGASSPCEYGDYYQWASTTPVTTTVCNESTCPYTEDGQTYTKYNKHDGRTVLEAKDDAIYQSTGGEAKIPTKADLEELINNTTHAWVVCSKELDHQNKILVCGELFTGKNGGKIFIPASGYRYDDSFNRQIDCGYVWSSSVNSDDVNYAWYFFLYSSFCKLWRSHRYNGFCLRGVKN